MMWIEIRAIGKSPSGKTHIFEVLTKDGAITLGVIKWFPAWRGYAFFPEKETVYEAICLNDIAKFIQEVNEAKRAGVAHD